MSDATDRAPGRVEFRVDGRDLALTALPGHAEGSYIALFTDATSASRRTR